MAFGVLRRGACCLFPGRIFLAYRKCTQMADMSSRCAREGLRWKQRWSRFHDKSSWQTLRCGTVGPVTPTAVVNFSMSVGMYLLVSCSFRICLVCEGGQCGMRCGVNPSMPIVACVCLSQPGSDIPRFVARQPLPSALQRTPKVRLAPLSNGQRGTDGLSDPSRVI